MIDADAAVIERLMTNKDGNVQRQLRGMRDVAEAKGHHLNAQYIAGALDMYNALKREEITDIIRYMSDNEYANA